MLNIIAYLLKVTFLGVCDSVMDELIQIYFSLGLSHKEILVYLQEINQKKISLRSLKRRLKRLKLYRRKNYSTFEDLVVFFQEQLNSAGNLHGYRWFHLKCLQNGFVVTQDIVRQLLLCLDPQGVELRKRKRLRRRQYANKGPNYLWHLDSYDKLKPYGICINGCIDGFSRQIIWLQAGKTSNNPRVSNYLNSNL